MPVFLEGYAAKKSDGALAFTVTGHPLAVDTDRIPVAGPLTPQAVAASGACIGLLRWDAGSFSVQPLAVEATVRRRRSRSTPADGPGARPTPAASRPRMPPTDAIVALRERAGRLLRK